MRKIWLCMIPLMSGLLFSSCTMENKDMQIISQEQYMDKTLAGILAHVGGTLTGYEFITEKPLPDDWFAYIEGPYSGRSKHKQQPNNVRLFNDQDGRIGSDDDYHIDFFNQMILDQYGMDVTYKQIMNMWTRYQVSDFGGGQAAMQNMNKGLIPPFSGKSEFSIFYHTTSSYIEQETIGMITPGMPAVTRDLSKKFASVTGESDNVIWAQFLSSMYAIAYFEDNAIQAMDRAAVVLPENSWPYQIYHKVKEVHAKYPDDWRKAHAVLTETVWKPHFGNRNPSASPDINNAMTILAILYGNNDFETSARIASLSGFDAETTASTVMGLLGIIVGMDGIPQQILDTVYMDGEGVFVNDLSFPPHFNKNFPTEIKFSDLAKLYQGNAEKVIVQYGGKVEDGVYIIPKLELFPYDITLLDNYDFENGDLSGWQVEASNDRLKDTHVYAQYLPKSFSGNYRGFIKVNDKMEEAKLYLELNNLDIGDTYRVKAFLVSDTNQESRLFVSHAGEEMYASIVDQTDFFASREVIFTAEHHQAKIGLHVIYHGQDGWGGIDDLSIEKIHVEEPVRYEAEDAHFTGVTVKETDTASGGKYVGALSEDAVVSFQEVTVSEAGEYVMSLNYANVGTEDTELLLYLNGSFYAKMLLPPTGKKEVFSQNVINVPVELQAGQNEIVLKHTLRLGNPQIDYMEISDFPTNASQNERANQTSGIKIL